MRFRIEEICEGKELQIQELADKIGISRIILTRNISENPPISTLRSIAAALDVHIVDLFERHDDFVAFVRDQGRIYTFDSIKALKVFADAAHEAAVNMRQFGEVVKKNKCEVGYGKDS